MAGAMLGVALAMSAAPAMAGTNRWTPVGPAGQAVDALVTAWHGQKWVDLPGHVRAVRRDRTLRFEPS